MGKCAPKKVIAVNIQHDMDAINTQSVIVWHGIEGLPRAGEENAAPGAAKYKRNHFSKWQ